MSENGSGFWRPGLKNGTGKLHVVVCNRRVRLIEVTGSRFWSEVHGPVVESPIKLILD